MRLKLFDTIDETLQLMDQHQDIYLEVQARIQDALHKLFDHQEMVVGMHSRIKSKDSFREKIIRNRLYVEFNSAQEILDNLHDLIGFCIECRFIDDEYRVLTLLRNYFSLRNEDDGYYCCEHDYRLFFDCDSHQPKIQKNGFAIYRIDGYYIENDIKVNVELQIKALVHSFWGDIEHKLVYKNTNYYVYDDFMKDLLASIKGYLTITDRQLNIIYEQMQMNAGNDGIISENGFEQQISKAINDLFAVKMNESVGFNLNIKNASAVLGHYIFIKDIRYDGGNNDRISTLFRTFKKLSSTPIDFEHTIEMEEKFYSHDIFIQTLGSYLLNIINDDYDWFVFFKMLFAIEPGNNMEDFLLFLKVIENYLVDHYWLNTSFIKLSMDDARLLHDELSRILASSLCEMNTIKIIHHQKMLKISEAFVHYVEELEQRVISYHDFMHYRDAYYQEWLNRMKKLFS